MLFLKSNSFPVKLNSNDIFIAFRLATTKIIEEKNILRTTTMENQSVRFIFRELNINFDINWSRMNPVNYICISANHATLFSNGCPRNETLPLIIFQRDLVFWISVFTMFENSSKGDCCVGSRLFCNRVNLIIIIVRSL